MNTQTALSLEVLNDISLSKKGITETATALTEIIQSGHINPLDSLTKLRAIRETLETVEKNIRDIALDELQKHGKKTVFNGVTIESAETGVKYDYTACNDVIWEDLNKQITELTEKRKNREEFLKLLKAPKAEINEDTGETYTVHPPVKSSTTVPKITFKS